MMLVKSEMMITGGRAVGVSSCAKNVSYFFVLIVQYGLNLDIIYSHCSLLTGCAECRMQNAEYEDLPRK